MINVSEHVVHTLQGDQSNLKKDLFFFAGKNFYYCEYKNFPETIQEI